MTAPFDANEPRSHSRVSGVKVPLTFFDESTSSTAENITAAMQNTCISDILSFRNSAPSAQGIIIPDVLKIEFRTTVPPSSAFIPQSILNAKKHPEHAATASVGSTVSDLIFPPNMTISEKSDDDANCRKI